MIHWRTRSEVRSQYNFKFDPGASTLDPPPPPWETQRRPGIELPWRLPASVVDLCCRALDCRHVRAVANGPSRMCSPLFFAWISIFSFLFCLNTSAILYRNRNEVDFRFAFRFFLDTPLGHFLCSRKLGLEKPGSDRRQKLAFLCSWKSAFSMQDFSILISNYRPDIRKN